MDIGGLSMMMERIRTAVDRVLGRVQAVRGKGEEATKQALVLPLLDALGYDIWHPDEVCPEFDADFAVKKTGQKEKVDIAVLHAGQPRIFVEVKACEVQLEGHEGQLARYFNAVPSVTLGILTNGVEWRFFTDTGDPNVMDAAPFHSANWAAADQGIEVLARFAKPVFSPEAIREYATELLYTARMADFLRAELDLRERDPSEYLMRWILKSEGMYEGTVNANVIERFRPIAKAALTRVVREIVRRSITAMEEGAAPAVRGAPVTPAVETAGPAEGASDSAESEDCRGEDADEGRGIVTTEAELQVFAIAKEQFEQSALSRATVLDGQTRRDVPVTIGYKDTQSYFGVYLHRPSWWFLRAKLDCKKPWVAFNLDPEAAAPLVPAGRTLLSGYAWAPFRILVAGPDDLHQLHRLVFAAMQRQVDEHQRAAEAPEPAAGA